MKKYLTPLILTILFLNILILRADNTETIEKLIKKGIELYDNKEFEASIKAFEEALKIDPNSMIANYELALSYLALNDYENAIKYSTKIINSEDKKILVGAYGIKSEALAETGRIDEAISLLVEALSEIGSNYYLHFNLALNYFNNGDLDNTIHHAERALLLDKFQSGPYLLSAYALSDKSMWIQSILAFQFFLTQEPNTLRSKVAFEEMLQTMQLKKETKKPVQRSFIQRQLERHSNTEEDSIQHTPLPLDTLNGIDRELIYNSINNTIDSLEITLNKDSLATDSTTSVLYESFKAVTRTIFTSLTQQNDGSKSGLLWHYKVPIITRIVESPYFDIYCRYISLAYIPESLKWWEENEEATQKFAKWLEVGDEVE